MDDSRLEFLNPSAMAELLAIDSRAEQLWSDDDMRQLLKHLLSIPVMEAITGTPEDTASVIQQIRSTDPPIRKLEDLFTLASPPAALLRLVMQQAKIWRFDVNRTLPEQVAAVIYFSASASGHLRLGDRLTYMPLDQWRNGLAWLRSQPWVDPSLVQLAAIALESPK